MLNNMVKGTRNKKNFRQVILADEVTNASGNRNAICEMCFSVRNRHISTIIVKSGNSWVIFCDLCKCVFGYAPISQCLFKFEVSREVGKVL